MMNIEEKARIMKMQLSCPRHGNAFMIQEGGAVYCGALTPNEISKKCFYHPSLTYIERKEYRGTEKILKPDVMSQIFKPKKRYIIKKKKKKKKRHYNKSVLQRMNKLMELDKK